MTFFNRPPATRRNKSKSNLLANNKNTSMIFFIGFLIGIVVTILIIFMLNNIKISPKKSFKKPLKSSKTLTSSNININSNKAINNNKSSNTTNIPTNYNANNYEFYNLLPKMGSQINLTQNQPYFIQAGSFHKIIEADELKAKLTLLGFEAKIENYSIHGNKQYRVLLGPFASEQIAITKKEQLNLAGFKHIFIKTSEN